MEMRSLSFNGATKKKVDQGMEMVGGKKRADRLDQIRAVVDSHLRFKSARPRTLVAFGTKANLTSLLRMSDADVLILVEQEAMFGSYGSHQESVGQALAQRYDKALEEGPPIEDFHVWVRSMLTTEFVSEALDKNSVAQESEYKRSKREYGHISGSLVRDWGGIHPVLEQELEALGVESYGLKIHYSGKRLIFEITFACQGKERRVILLQQKDPRSLEGFTHFLREQFAPLDLFVFLAEDHAARWSGLRDLDEDHRRTMSTLMRWMPPRSLLITDTVETLPDPYERVHYFNEILLPPSNGASFGAAREWTLDHAPVILQRRQTPRAAQSVRHLNLGHYFSIGRFLNQIDQLRNLMADGGEIHLELPVSYAQMHRYWRTRVDQFLALMKLDPWSEIRCQILQRTPLGGVDQFPGAYWRIFQETYEAEDTGEETLWRSAAINLIEIMRLAKDRHNHRALRKLREDERAFRESLAQDRRRLEEHELPFLGDEHQLCSWFESFGFVVQASQRNGKWEVVLTRQGFPRQGYSPQKQNVQNHTSFGIPGQQLLVDPLRHGPRTLGEKAKGAPSFLDYMLGSSVNAFRRASNRFPELEEKAEIALTYAARRFDQGIKVMGLQSLSLEDRAGYLVEQVGAVEAALRGLLMGPNPTTTEGVEKIVHHVHAGMPMSGYFVRDELLEEWLTKIPPKHLLMELGITAGEAIAQFGVREIFSVSRVTEPATHLCQLLRAYRRLEPSDMEKRPVSMLVFPRERYPGVAEKLDHKLTIWNDKVAGTVFGVPFSERHNGFVRVLRLFTRAAHYLAELANYQVLNLEILSGNEKHFGERFSQVLRGFDRYSRQSTPFFHPHHLQEMLAWERATEFVFDVLGKHFSGRQPWSAFSETWTAMQLIRSGRKLVPLSLNFLDVVTMASRLRGSILHAQEMMRLVISRQVVDRDDVHDSWVLRHLDVPDLLADDVRREEGNPFLASAA